MDIGSIFLILALLIPVVLFIGRPLFEHTANSALKRGMISREDQELSSLLAERDRVVTTLQELDFDSTMGKIPEGEYPTQRALLVQHGVEVLRKLDILTHGQPQPEPLTKASLDLESVIAARRAARQPPPAVGRSAAASNGNGARLQTPDDKLEQMIASRRRARQEKTSGFCPKCGKPVQKSDHFCPKCGTKLA